jgi:hypothetical protein
MPRARLVCGSFIGLTEYSALARTSIGSQVQLNGGRKYGKDSVIRRCVVGSFSRLFHSGQSLPHGYAGIGLLVSVQEIDHVA